MTDTFANIRDITIVANEPKRYKCTLDLTRNGKEEIVTYYANNVNVPTSVCTKVFEAIEKIGLTKKIPVEIPKTSEV